MNVSEIIKEALQKKRQLLTVYCHDEDGYFSHESSWQLLDKDYATSPLSTPLCPWGIGEMDENSFYRFDGKKWIVEPISENPDDYLDVLVPHESNTPHSHKLREIIGKFAKLEGYFERRDENNALGLGKTKPKTPADILEEEANREEEELKRKSQELLVQFARAKLLNNEEMAKAFQDEYMNLFEEE